MSGYPDNATPTEVLAYLRACLSCHNDEVRFVGNLRVVDALRALTWVDMQLGREPAKEQADGQGEKGTT